MTSSPDIKTKPGGPSRVKRWKKILLVIAISLLSLEIVLQILAYLSPLNFLPHNLDRYWETRFLREYPLRGKETGMTVTHETRGWTVQSGYSSEGGGLMYTINDMGYRSPRKVHEESEDKFRVMVLGNSFTFGWDCDDRTTWPQTLENLDPRLQVINLGVGGYGIDQMLVTLRESIRVFKPQLVIVAFIGDNLFRSLLSFRDYKKPLFILENDELILTNIPIGTREETYRSLQDKTYPPRLMLWVLARKAYNRLFKSDADILFPSPQAEILCEELNTRLLLEMIEVAREHKAEILFVHLAWGKAIRDKSYECYGEEFLNRFVEVHNVPHATTRESFLKGSGWTKGHYQEKEAGLVAECVYERLNRIPAWRDYAFRNLKN